MCEAAQHMHKVIDCFISEGVLYVCSQFIDPCVLLHLTSTVLCRFEMWTDVFCVSSAAVVLARTRLQKTFLISMSFFSWLIKEINKNNCTL